MLFGHVGSLFAVFLQVALLDDAPSPNTKTPNILNLLQMLSTDRKAREGDLAVCEPQNLEHSFCQGLPETVNPKP